MSSKIQISCPNPSCKALIDPTDAGGNLRENCPACGSPLNGRPASGQGPTAEFDYGNSPPTRMTSSVPDSFGGFLGTPNDDFLAPGSVFAERYKIIKELGRGGMGVVVQARDLKLPRDVALKIPLRLHFGEMHRRFLTEANAAATLDHPNICRILDLGESGGIPYIVLAFVDGKTLAQAVNRRAVDPVKAAKIARNIARTLQYAHDKGISHRDLKPANLMIGSRGELIVMDFGLARDDTATERHTVDGQAIGTLYYMAPEQVEGRTGDMGKSCDIYTLGVILYEMLAGRLPFVGPAWEVPTKILREAAEPPSTLQEAVDPELDAIVARAMAKAIPDRFNSMTEFAAALEVFIATHREGTSSSQVGIVSNPSGTGMKLDSNSRPGSPPFVDPNGPTLPNSGTTLAGLPEAPKPDAPTDPPDKPIKDVSDTFGGQIEAEPEPNPIAPGHGALLWGSIAVSLMALLVAALAIIAYSRGGPTTIASAPNGEGGGKTGTSEIPPNSPPPPPPPPPPSSITSRSFKNLEMVLIKAGEFQMGTNRFEDDEQPIHTVKITRPFYMAIHEVQLNQWRRVMEEHEKTGTPVFPVYGVQFDDAIKFCNKLSRMDDLEPYYIPGNGGLEILSVTGKGYRLPTEAEWEYACRAGTTTPYPWAAKEGNLHAWYQENSKNSASEAHYPMHRVGTKQPNAFGLYDMMGNVSEWCWDYYDHGYYSEKSALIDPTGPPSGSFRVIRGGCSADPMSELRSARRHSANVGGGPGPRPNHPRYIGFRVARNVP